MKAYIASVLISLSFALFVPRAAAADGLELIAPSAADPRIANFDWDNVIINNSNNDHLVVFLPGTNGQPRNATKLLTFIADLGYRVIGLSYNDEPAVSQVCPRDPNPDCSAEVRRVRSFGGTSAQLQNPPAETIFARLQTLLIYLDHVHPGAGWGKYLAADGAPDWQQITLSGISQGAGMAAYIAKTVKVRRVVLFSGPWDTTGRSRMPAPWLFEPSATPLDRWWAERHTHEVTTTLISNAYQALQMNSNHVLLFDLPLNNDRQAKANPFHSSTIHDMSYAAAWRIMFTQ